MAASASDMRPAGVAQEAIGLSGVMTCLPMTGSQSSSRSRLRRATRHDRPGLCDKPAAPPPTRWPTAGTRPHSSQQQSGMKLATATWPMLNASLHLLDA